MFQPSQQSQQPLSGPHLKVKALDYDLANLNGYDEIYLSSPRLCLLDRLEPSVQRSSDDGCLGEYLQVQLWPSDVLELKPEDIEFFFNPDQGIIGYSGLPHPSPKVAKFLTLKY